MKRLAIFALAVASTSTGALALPEVGDIVGTTPKTAKQALADKGCDLQGFEAEGGMIEARCIDVATSKFWEVTIDPKTGAVTKLKNRD